MSSTSLNAEISNHTASAPRSTAAIRISERSFAEASRLSTGVREIGRRREALSGLFANRPRVITRAAAPLKDHRVTLNGLFEGNRVGAVAVRTLRRNLQRQAIRHKSDLNPSVAPKTTPPRWVPFRNSSLVGLIPLTHVPPVLTPVSERFRHMARMVNARMSSGESTSQKPRLCGASSNCADPDGAIPESRRR